jgi:hypothetical protein
MQAAYASFGDFDPNIEELKSELRKINEILWEMEYGVRDCAKTRLRRTHYRIGPQRL